ncbi:pyridoxamine 5'-phosphate oxidase family protein [Spongiivirga sp. MCCC 1A20706]|uniref:pyridoxamine 5'-phosphate oxidase family protein n=1 Tax=Spongiivirga sp. MCCC 1A20706 TaxID=3160963 RepID=UPI003977DB85
MSDIILAKIHHELHAALDDPAHPFRLFVLATIAEDTTPVVRTMKVREVKNDMRIRVYTDRRSTKVSQIEENDTVSLLFYNPNSKLQLIFKATATLKNDPVFLSKIWNNMPLHSRKEYLTKKKPGSPIDDPTAVEYLSNTDYFTVIEFIPKQIEYLQLQPHNHTRVIFTQNLDGWESKYVVA